MRTIAIVLGDNDFGRTFKPLLETVYRAWEWHGPLEMPHADYLRNAIRELIKGHYLLFQVSYDYRPESQVERADKTAAYLGSIRILFDEEAEQDIMTRDHDGGAWYLELATGLVYSY